jgi:hypothetical protein
MVIYLRNMRVFDNCFGWMGFLKCKFFNKYVNN